MNCCSTRFCGRQPWECVTLIKYCMQMQYNVTAANYQAQKIFAPSFSSSVEFYLLGSEESTLRRRKLAVKSFHFSFCDHLLEREKKGRRATCSLFLITKLTVCVFLWLLHARTLSCMCFAVNWLVCHLENTLSGKRKGCVFFLTWLCFLLWLG